MANLNYQKYLSECLTKYSHNRKAAIILIWESLNEITIFYQQTFFVNSKLSLQTSHSRYYFLRIIVHPDPKDNKILLKKLSSYTQIIGETKPKTFSCSTLSLKIWNVSLLIIALVGTKLEAGTIDSYTCEEGRVWQIARRGQVSSKIISENLDDKEPRIHPSNLITHWSTNLVSTLLKYSRPEMAHSLCVNSITWYYKKALWRPISYVVNTLVKQE